MYTKESITKTLENLGNIIKEPLTIYLIGGGALSLRNLKVATKDIDIVVLNQKDLDLLTKAFRKLDFKNPAHLKEEIYLTALAVFMKEESRIDIFLKEVCKKLKFSKAMQGRAHNVAVFGKLTVKAASNEDIFLFKSLAVESDREHDIIDCTNLFRRRLDWDVIIEECAAQHKEKTKWIFWLFEFICRFEDKENLEVPIKEKVFFLCKEDWEHKPDDFLHLVDDLSKHIRDEKLRKEVGRIKKKN